MLLSGIGSMMNAKPKAGLIVQKATAQTIKVPPNGGMDHALCIFVCCLFLLQRQYVKSVTEAVCIYGGLLPVPEQWRENFRIVYVSNVPLQPQRVSMKCERAGPLPVPEKWNEDLAKGAFNLEETDIGSSDQVEDKGLNPKP